MKNLLFVTLFGTIGYFKKPLKLRHPLVHAL